MNNLEIVKFFEYNLKTGRLSPFYLLPDEKRLLEEKGEELTEKCFKHMKIIVFGQKMT